MNTTPPRIFAFYAYKGGTGRSFALAHTAWALAREGKRLVLIDLDLAAPSLWSIFGQEPARGFIEYVQSLRNGSPLDVRELIQEIPLDSKAQGALYLLQAGRMDKSYLQALQTLDWHELLHRQPPRARSRQSLFDLTSPFDELLTAITEQLEPDAVLIDAPTGFNDTANLCLRMLADVVVALFAPTRVHLEGIGRVVSLLTAEQQRMQSGEPSRPEVFCVASTLLLSRVGGSQMQRITRCFKHLAEIRYDAIGRPEDLSGEQLDTVQQDLAVISYDERISETEILPTKEEPRANHFAVFHDVLGYVRNSLPVATPVTLSPSEKPSLLDEMQPRFGMFAEQEGTNVESLFLRTKHVDQVKEPRVVLILGGKGSGKTALWQYLSANEGTIPVHGPGHGVGPDLLCQLQDAEPSMDVFWRLYLLSSLPELSLVQDSDVRNSALALRSLPTDPSSMQTVESWLKRLGVAVRLNSVWADLDGIFAMRSTQRVLCLDGLGAAFKADVKRRERGLVGLFTAWQATFASLQHVNLKVCLRTDLWERLSFPEKSQLRGRELRLAWPDADLWRLILKRALASAQFKAWCSRSLASPGLNESSVEAAGERDLFPYLDRLFEARKWAGKNALSRNWILRRLKDGKGTLYPRDVLCLLFESIKSEHERLHDRRVSEASVISRESLSESLTPTSRQRVDAVREEYPELIDVLDALRGLSSTGSLEDLKQRVTTVVNGEVSVEGAITLLIEAGVVAAQEGEYSVPDLYRHGLQMRRQGPR